MRLAFALVVLMTSIGSSPLMAADICEAVAIRNVAAVESPDSVLRKGEVDGAITQYRVSKKTGKAVFCSHGGYCYPADGLKLTNCKVGAREDYSDPDDVFYAVDVIRSKVPAARLRYDDLDNQLLEIGLCSACASNAAQEYISHPNSSCGRKVKAALEGNPVARRALTEGDGCH